MSLTIHYYQIEENQWLTTTNTFESIMILNRQTLDLDDIYRNRFQYNCSDFFNTKYRLRTNKKPSTQTLFSLT